MGILGGFCSIFASNRDAISKWGEGWPFRCNFHDSTIVGATGGVLWLKLGCFCVKMRLHFQMGGRWGILVRLSHFDNWGDNYGVF